MDNVKLTELQDYYDRLEKADWFFEMSDDGQAFRAGVAQFSELKAEAAANPQKRALYDAYGKYVYSGEPWGTEKSPKPTRPT